VTQDGVGFTRTDDAFVSEEHYHLSMLSASVFMFVCRKKDREKGVPTMKKLLLAFGFVVMSAVSSMAGPQDSPYLCNVADSQHLADVRICS
jgi:hypothetical protein